MEKNAKSAATSQPKPGGFVTTERQSNQDREHNLLEREGMALDDGLNQLEAKKRALEVVDGETWKRWQAWVAAQSAARSKNRR